MTTTTGNTPTIADALRAILTEVTPGTRPYSGDSYLPDHLIDAARLALEASKGSIPNPTLTDTATQQHAFNALSMAAWHCARGEPAQALARIRRAKSHIMTSMGAAA